MRGGTEDEALELLKLLGGKTLGEVTPQDGAPILLQGGPEVFQGRRMDQLVASHPENRTGQRRAGKVGLDLPEAPLLFLGEFREPQLLKFRGPGAFEEDSVVSGPFQGQDVSIEKVDPSYRREEEFLFAFFNPEKSVYH